MWKTTRLLSITTRLSCIVRGRKSTSVRWAVGRQHQVPSLNSRVVRQAASTPTVKKEPEEDSNENRDLSQTVFNDDPYPQDFKPTHTVEQFQKEWGHIETGARIEDVTVRLAGRIRAKRTAGKKLVFYDIVGDGSPVQVCSVRKFSLSSSKGDSESAYPRF